MKILGFQPESYMDWQKGLASVIYTGNCNFNCPSCHAGGLIKKEEQIDEKSVLKKLEARKRFLNKVVICGGEPTLERDLPNFMRKLKDLGFLVKLDTNGSNPEILEGVVGARLVDYVAMDIKAPRQLYAQITDTPNLDLSNIERSIKAVSSLQDYEFRTTLWPIYDPADQSRIRWMSPQEIGEMASWIVDITGGKNHKYFLQKFQARGQEEMIDKKFGKENLAEEYQSTPDLLMKECLVEARKYIPNCEIR
jgi:pyruvate formate lyase activating enzyme